MEKFTREVVFEGINDKIKETLNELGYTIEYLDDFCTENDFELIVETRGCIPHEGPCLVGWDDAETSENISDALWYLYENNFTDDNDLMYDIYISNGVEKTFVGILDIKDYTGLVIVDRYGIETNSEFVNAIVEKVDESLNNNNLQDTEIYKSIFKTQEDIDDDEKYNTNYDLLIDRITKSVKKYMLEDTERRFDHYVSCYYFFEVPTVRDYYIDDITDILSYNDR